MIFKSAGFETVESRLFLTGLFGISKLVSATAFMFVFVRMRGNRFWLKLGSAICGISMLILGMSLILERLPATKSTNSPAQRTSSADQAIQPLHPMD